MLFLSGKNGTAHNDEPAMTEQEEKQFNDLRRVGELRRIENEENNADIQQAMTNSMETSTEHERSCYGGGG